MGKRAIATWVFCAGLGLAGCSSSDPAPEGDGAAPLEAADADDDAASSEPAVVEESPPRALPSTHDYRGDYPELPEMGETQTYFTAHGRRTQIDRGFFRGALRLTGAGITKEGAGTLAFGGAGSNTYTGTTTVNTGTLALGKTGGATAVAGNLSIGGSGVVRLDASNQIADTSAVTLGATGTPTLNLNGFAERIGSLTSSNPAAVVAFGSPGSATDFTVGDSTSTTYAGTFTSGNANGRLVKEGGGALTLAGDSSGFSGPVLVNDGTLKLTSNYALGSGVAGTTVTSGATLQIDGGRLNTANGTLTLAGTGDVGAGGALIGSGGNNRWNSNLVLGGNTTISTGGTGYLALGVTTTRYDRLNDPSGTVTDPTTLDLGANTLTLSGTTSAGDGRAIYLNTRITGTGNLVVDMTNPGDIARMTTNLNTYTGTTTIKNGTLSIATLYNTFPNDPAHPNYFAINGPMTIGDGTGAANSARLTIQANGGGVLYDEMMNFTTPVTLFQDGQLSLLAAQSINTLTFNGGNIDLGATGGLYLNGDVTVNASAGNTATIAGSSTSTLSLTIQQGPVPVPNSNRVFNVIGGVGNASDLSISAKINNGSITKNGVGTMTITGDNSGGYEGTTTVNNGILAITHNNALGLADATDTTATTVNGNGATNGTLQLSGGITVSNEKLTLNNTGFGNNGALRNLADNNTWAGQVIVNDARVQSDAGLLTLSGTSTINTALEVTGSGNTTISGSVGGASGTLTKNGSGTLTLSGINTFGGNTTINGGVLSLQSNTGLGSTSARTTVNSGAALELSNVANGNLTTSAEPLFLNGTGLGGNGALRNAAGNNTFGGLVTLQSDSLVTANSGTTLTLSGGTSSANFGLTVGTTTNNGNVTISGDISNGTGSLTKDGSGTLTFSGTSGTVGATHLNQGILSVSGSSTLNTGALDSATSTTLIVASGGTVSSTYGTGTTTFFSGVMDGDGTFEKKGDGTLVFNHSTGFDASNLTLVLDGGTVRFVDTNPSGTSLFEFGTIHITGNTILDFNNSAGTFLSSANLVIDAGVTVTVNNWISVANDTSLSTVWYANSTVNAGSLGGSDLVGGTPLGQITFTNYNGLTTTWVSGNHDGWFDHEIRPTPEPSTYGAIFLLGCFGLFGWRRWRQRQAPSA